MSVTAAQVISRINKLFSNTTGGKWTDAELLEAVNAAIDDAWPHMRAVSQDTSQTLASTTYEYTPSATPEVEYGFALAYVSRDNYPDALLRRVKQRQNGTAFTVILPYDVTSTFAGETLKLLYNSRVARVDETTDSIELPLDYLWKGAALWLHVNKMLDEAKADVDAYERLIVKFERDVERSKMAHARGHLPHRIPIVAEQGLGQVAGRYGQNIISNP